MRHRGADVVDDSDAARDPHGGQQKADAHVGQFLELHLGPPGRGGRPEGRPSN
ncbi:MAG TPA: hypothetical protein VM573_06065 [Actinomycetota bacterium]|nr:hypothetical protein [Actinomycetota bacterium]